jgi:hypothetical protein
MDCWSCGSELIWGGDENGDEEDVYEIVTNLSCPCCKATVIVYHGYNEEKDE